MRHYKQSDTYFCRSMDTKMERVMNKNKVPRKRGEVLIHSFKQSDTYFCRSMDTKMEKVMNNNKVPKKSGEVITRVKLPGDCDIFNEFVEDDSMEFSVCLFKADTCFIIPQDDALWHKLLHFRPDKQKKYPQFTGSKYSSFIVYRNTLGKLVTIGNVPECKQMFTELEERISYSHRREVDYFDLINASKKTSGSRSPPIIQANSEFIGRNRDSQRNGIMAYISTSFINHDKVVPPGPIADNEKIVKPADKNTYENPPYPAQESTHGFGEQAVSGSYTRNELFRSDITHEESGFHRYSPSLYSGLQPSSDRPTRSTPAPAFPEYRNYATRKATFERWGRVYPSASDFTNAGFFLTDEDDLVRCFQCGIGLREITTETIPLVEHAKYSRECPFLKESLGTEELNQLQVQSQNAPREPTYPGRSLQSFSRYRHPEYRLYTTRLATFDNWPSALGQQPEQLAQAGLYYTGIDDLVRCFSCDGGLRRWEPDDNPWIEHCRWFPTCPFAIEVKGEDFINMVLSASAEMDGAFGVDDEQASSQPTHLLTKQSPTVTAILNEHRATVVKMMGFDEDEFVEAVLELKRRDANTTVEDILEVIEINKDRKVKEEELKTLKEENPYELNRRLKNFLVCCVCNKNEANALFLPCCHHNTCVTCAEVMTKCPKCTRPIQQTIKTYLG